MNKIDKRGISIFLGVLLSLCILSFLFYQVKWSELIEQLYKINYLYLPLLALLFIISFIFRSLRWRYLLPTSREFSTTKMFSACIIGMLASNLLPLRAGEFIRPWVLSRNSNISFSLAFSSVVTERVFDVLAMLTLLALSLSTINNPPAIVSLGAKSLGLIALFILGFMLLAYFKSASVINRVEKLIAYIFKNKSNLFAEKVLLFVADFIRGLKAINSFKQLLIVIIWSYILWGLFSLFYYLILLSFGIEGNLLIGNTINVFVALAIAAPSAPGFLGTFHAGCLAALTIYGFSDEFALAYSILAHSLQFILSIISGLIMLNYEGLKFKELSNKN